MWATYPRILGPDPDSGLPTLGLGPDPESGPSTLGFWVQAQDLSNLPWILGPDPEFWATCPMILGPDPESGPPTLGF